MANVKFQNLSKSYGNFLAIKNLNLEIADHEFLCLVGPSGCGKTTCLRMLAGLEDVTEGEIFIENQNIINVEPKNRDIAMVFQSYALYPHYSVYDNLAFGLRTRSGTGKASGLINFFNLFSYGIIILILWGIGQFLNIFLPNIGNTVFNASLIGFIMLLILYDEFRNEIRDKIITITKTKLKIIQNCLVEEESIKLKINETAKLLGIEEQLMKKPKQLSGGQRQRVALGRAIIRNPKVFLMDEPLSNLDAKLRVQMRAELQRLTKKLKVTTLYVTHDQIEAMTLGDRIAVLNLGELQQIGSPHDLYENPKNKFVAGFIGSPSMNFITGEIKLEKNDLFFISEAFRYQIPKWYDILKTYENKKVILGIRPEHISLGENLKSTNAIQTKIGVLEPIGSDTYVYIDFPADKTFVVKLEGLTKFQINQSTMAEFEDNNVFFFDPITELRLLPKT